MAAKTFTVTAVGVTAGQQLDAATTVLKVTGTLSGGLLIIEASNADSGYVRVTQSLDTEADGIYTLQLPSGWYVRTRFAGNDAPSATVIVE